MAGKKTSPSANENHKHVLVLGAGHIGGLIAQELHDQGNTVTVIDKRSDEELQYPYATFRMDGPEDIASWKSHSLMLFYNTSVEDFFRYHLDDGIKNQGLIINALPGDVSYEVLKMLIPLGIDIVDISFMEQDPRDLNEMALLYNTRVIYDCGIAPGLCNAILGHHYDTSEDGIHSYECFVGGLPVVRTKPFQYKTLFSIKDTLSEYTRPARYKRQNEICTIDPMDYYDCEFDGFGSFEAFPIDGLRSLLDIWDIPEMDEYTLRYPGHMEEMILLKEMGLLEPDQINDTIQKLNKHWSWGSEPANDIMFMQIKIDEFVAKKGDPQTKHKYTIYDKATDGVTAMARTTGYSCIAMIDLLGCLTPGVYPPELAIYTTPELTKDSVFATKHPNSVSRLEHIFEYLRSKGITIEKTKE
jgi:saccharopine dehydrogenase-like NADP-dependent oxidoreductase